MNSLDDKIKEASEKYKKLKKCDKRNEEMKLIHDLNVLCEQIEKMLAD